MTTSGFRRLHLHAPYKPCPVACCSEATSAWVEASFCRALDDTEVHDMAVSLCWGDWPSSCMEQSAR